MYLSIRFAPGSPLVHRYRYIVQRGMDVADRIPICYYVYLLFNNNRGEELCVSQQIQENAGQNYSHRPCRHTYNGSS